MRDHNQLPQQVYGTAGRSSAGSAVRLAFLFGTQGLENHVMRALEDEASLYGSVCLYLLYSSLSPQNINSYCLCICVSPPVSLSVAVRLLSMYNFKGELLSSFQGGQMIKSFPL